MITSSLPRVRDVCDELLRRAGIARVGDPWVVALTAASCSPIDYDLLDRHAHALDLSEESVARIAVSLATGSRVNLHQAFRYLTRDHAQLVMTAIAYAGGHHMEGIRVSLIDGRRQIEIVPPLSRWPSQLVGPYEVRAGGVPECPASPDGRASIV